MIETPLNPDLERIIRAELGRIRTSDSMCRAAYAASRYIGAHLHISANSVVPLSLAIVKQIMREDEPALLKCPYCSGYHSKDQMERCPLNPHKKG